MNEWWWPERMQIYVQVYKRVVTNNHEDDHDGNARLILVKTLLLTPNAD